MIFGLETSGGLPEGCIALEAVAVVKVMAPDGDMALYIDHSPGLTAWDQLGLLHAAAGTTQDDLNRVFRRSGE